MSDPQYLQRLDVEVIPPVPFGEVVGWMSRACSIRFCSGQFSATSSSSRPASSKHQRPIRFHCSGSTGASEGDLRRRGARPRLAPDDVSMTRSSTWSIVLIIMPAIVQGIRDELRVKHSHVARLRELIEHYRRPTGRDRFAGRG